MKTNILLAFSDQPWQLEVMSNLNDHPQIKIKRRCIDSVDLMSGVHLGLANKIVLSSDFPNLNLAMVTSAKKLGCDIYGICLQDDIESIERLQSLGITNNYILSSNEVTKSLKNLINELINFTEIDNFSNEIENQTSIPGLISVWGTNGSPGRTSVAINLAFNLARRNSATLLIDLDAVAPSIAASLGLVSEVPGISSVVHDAIKGRLNTESIEKNVIQVDRSLHVLTGISNAKRWPELRTEGLLQVLKFCSGIYQNIVCDLSSVLPETTDSSLNDIDIFKRFDHIPKVIELAQKNIYVLSANPLSLIRASESLEALSEISPIEPLIIMNKLNNFCLGDEYEQTVNAILGRWTNPELIQRIPDKPEIFAKSWNQAESILDIGDEDLVKIYDVIANQVINETYSPPKLKRLLRKVS